MAPSLVSAAVPAGPFSTASPGGAGAADRRRVAISSPAVAVAAAGRSPFPGGRGGILLRSVTPFEDPRFFLRFGRGERPGSSGFLEGVFSASSHGIAPFRDPGVAAARRLISLVVAVPEEVRQASDVGGRGGGRGGRGGGGGNRGEGVEM